MNEWDDFRDGGSVAGEVRMLDEMRRTGSTSVSVAEKSALSSRAGEKMPELDVTDADEVAASLNFTDITDHELKTLAVTISRHLACRERQLRDSYDLVSSLRSQLEAKDKENASLRKRIHHTEKHNQQFFRCESAWCNPSDDVGGRPALEMFKGAVERAEKAEAALSTAERDAIKKALEAVKGERLIVKANVDKHPDHNEALDGAESAILALLQKESVS